jgi:hypothetical protein
MRRLRRGLHAPTVNRPLLLDEVSGGRQSEGRMNPQLVLNAFQGVVDRAENLRKMQIGREVVGIAARVAKLINAERQKAEHVIQAATVALAQLEG